MDEKKTHGNCFSFLGLYKGEAKSNRGNVVEKIKIKDFCGKFHCHVNPHGKICRHWDGIEKEEDQDE